MLTINFTTLPIATQESVKSDLYMYNQTFVRFENGEWSSSPHTMLHNGVKYDDFKMYKLTRDDVYTKEEQEENRRIFNEETKNMDWEAWNN